MTIAVGLLCSSGIVLSADTQYTHELFDFEVKTEGPKLFTIANRAELAVAAAGAGSVPFMKRAVEKLEEGYKELDGPTIKEVRKKTEEVLEAFYSSHIYPVTPSHRQPGFKLILGVKAADGFGLFETDLTIVTPTISVCIGIGKTVSSYSLALVSGGNNIEETKLAAAFAVKAAKDRVNGCGGKTGMLTITKQGIKTVLSSEVSEMDEYSESLFEWIRILLTYADTEDALTNQDDAVQSVTEVIRDYLLEFRSKKRARIEKARLAEEKRSKRQQADTA